MTIFSSSYLRTAKINLINDSRPFIKASYDGLRFVHIRSRKYKGNGLGRMYSLIQFSFRLLLNYNKFDKPDIIVHNIHAPFDYPVSFIPSLTKSKYVVEAWDLWPESFERFGMVSSKNVFLRLAYILEKRLYCKADRIVFTMPGARAYLESKGYIESEGGPISEEKIFYINNGLDLNAFRQNLIDFPFSPSGGNTDVFRVVYMGSLSQANNLIQLIKAAEVMRNINDVQFYIFGDGSERVELIQYCNDKGLSNVLFMNKWIPLREVPGILEWSSVNILNYRHDFGKYGLSSGKLFQYLASGTPIICNIHVEEDLIKSHNLGVSGPLNTPEEYANAILSIRDLRISEYKEMSERIRKVAELYDYSILSEQFKSVLLSYV